MGIKKEPFGPTRPAPRLSTALLAKEMTLDCPFRNPLQPRVISGGSCYLTSIVYLSFYRMAIPHSAGPGPCISPKSLRPLLRLFLIREASCGGNIFLTLRCGMFPVLALRSGKALSVQSDWHTGLPTSVLLSVLLFLIFTLPGLASQHQVRGLS